MPPTNPINPSDFVPNSDKITHRDSEFSAKTRISDKGKTEDNQLKIVRRAVTRLKANENKDEILIRQTGEKKNQSIEKQKEQAQIRRAEEPPNQDKRIKGNNLDISV